MKTVFRLEDVSFSYPNGKTALNHINLTINEGEMLCILGVNGCGKTTLLKMLSGLLFPTGGRFTAFGKEMTQSVMNDEAMAREYHKRIGFIFQDPDVQLFCPTVEEEIAFGLLQGDLPADEAKRRVLDVSRLLGIEHLLSAAPFQLSGGEKKKVALASVLAMNPEVLILDEPTNGLDPKTQRYFAHILLKLAKAGKTLITSTHNLELVQELSHRAVLFDENHTIIADAETQSLLSDSDLLIKANFVDEHYHRHDGNGHLHFHIHN